MYFFHQYVSIFFRFHQAYTTIIEDTVRESFEAVGLRFVANNYAMDGMTSGPELALCMESIYGFNIDILNWCESFHTFDFAGIQTCLNIWF